MSDPIKIVITPPPVFTVTIDPRVAGIQGPQGPQGETGPQGQTGATGATGPQGPAGSDANVTNTNVNAAISTNSGATRTALGLGNAALATTSTGGNGSADSGKVMAFGANGNIRASGTITLFSTDGTREGTILPPLNSSALPVYTMPNVTGTFALTSNASGQVQWSEIGAKPSTFTPSAHTHPASEISDSTTTGRALITAANATSALTTLQLKIRGPLRVACIGTSITNQGGTTVATNLQSPRHEDLSCGHSGWLEHLSNHRVRLVRRYGVMETVHNKNFGYSGYGLTGLTTGSAGLYPADQVLSTDAEVIVAEGGTNDTASTSAEIITKITAYWTKLRSTGLPVIALNIPPQGSAFASVGGVRDKITTVNAALPAIAASLGVTLVDIYSLCTLDGNGYATTESIWDGLHPTPAAAQRWAKAIDTVLAPYYAARQPEFLIPFATSSSASALWIGSDVSPFQNTKPTSWTAIGLSGSTTYAQQTDANGTKWQRVSMVSSSPGTPGTNFGFFKYITTGFTAGDKVRFCVRLRIQPSSAPSVSEVDFSLKINDGANKYVRALYNGTNLGVGQMTEFGGLFISPEVTIPTGTTELYPNFYFYGSNVVVDIKDFGVFKTMMND